MAADHELEDHKAKPRARGEAGVDEPEACGRHRLAEAADPADETVRDKEGQVIEPDDRGVDRFRRILGEEREADRQQMGEADAVQEVETRPARRGRFFARRFAWPRP